jgi:hypothetical protein
VLPVLVLVVDNNGGGNPPFIGPHLPPVIDVNINPFLDYTMRQHLGRN